jgi:16S rRNA G1207 methylase RsmC
MNTHQPGPGHPSAAVTRWTVGDPPDALPAGEGLVALTAFGLSDGAAEGGPALGFHEAMVRDDLPRAPRLDVLLPTYRGKGLVAVLSWLIARRLAAPDGEVTWSLTKQQGAASFPRLLTSLGWRDVRRSREGKLYKVVGRPPADAVLPEPQTFTARLGGNPLTFAADYGVFSPGHVDDGTAHLLDVALRQPHTPAVADIGIGYGALTLGLVRAGVADRAVATDVDCVALWLAATNARANGVPLDVVCTPDPAGVPDTPLTVCNVPTHIDMASTAAFMGGLAQRAADGRRLLAVVHASLVERYARYLTDAGLTARRHHGTSHVVFEVGG